MIENRSWAMFDKTYRATEMERLANWIRGGVSGNVVGLLGSGRSNVLGFLCARPDALQCYLPAEMHAAVVVVPVDLNDLPADDLSTLYRIILRAFSRVSNRFEPTLQQPVIQFYQDHKHVQDPFVTQSALHDLLMLCQSHRMQIVLVMNRFDTFCLRRATPDMINTLRALRDNFRDTLSYIVGMAQEVSYLPDPEALGDMYQLVDSHTCWVGAMNEADTRFVIRQNIHNISTSPSEEDLTVMADLAGKLPVLLQSVSQWWLTRPADLPQKAWGDTLLQRSNIQHRLSRIWAGLTQEERFVLSKVQEAQTQARRKKSIFKGLREQYQPVLDGLADKGVCVPEGIGYEVLGELLFRYVANVEKPGRGRLWIDEYDQIFQGTELIKLQGLMHELLGFLIKHPYTRHTRDALIYHLWPEDEEADGEIENKADEEGGWREPHLYHLIRELRKKVEPNPSEPVYIVTWSGKPVGGYRLYPEGKPVSGSQADG